MKAISAGASSTSGPSSPSSMRARMTRTHRQPIQLEVAGDGSGCRIACARSRVQQSRQHTEHTLLTAQRHRGVRHRRLAHQQRAPPWLIVQEPQERHQARAHPRKPGALPPAA